MDSLLHLLAIIVVGGLWAYVTVAMLRSSESRTSSWTPDGTAGPDKGPEGFAPINLDDGQHGRVLVD